MVDETAPNDCATDGETEATVLDGVAEDPGANIRIDGSPRLTDADTEAIGCADEEEVACEG